MLILTCSALTGYAQTAALTGTVVDEKGQPLPGVSIKVKNTQQGTVTDVAGKYTLNAAAASGVLVFNYIGYNPLELPYNGAGNVDAKLTPSQRALEDVVVVGYGTQRRTSVTGAVDQVTTAAIEGKPSANLTQALQGVSPNLTIQQRNNEPGAPANINIRGVSTMGNNSPLVVIDGLVGGDINLLNPQDIESISVLKDAGSAAIYGSRSSNGVLLVTTKKGKKNSRSVLTYNGLVGVQIPKTFYKPVDGYQNALLRNEANTNVGLQPVFNADRLNAIQQQGNYPFFLDEILKNSIQQNHNVSLSGGSEKSTYLVSAGYLDQRSNLVGPNYGLRRYNYRMNMTNEYGKLKLTSILAYARSEIKDHSSTTSTLIVDASRVPTIYRLKDDQGRYLTNEALSEFNPLGILEQGGYRKYDNDNLYGNLNAELAVTDFFKLRGVFGGTLNANHQFARIKQVNYYPSGVSGADRNTNDENLKDLLLNTQLLAEFNKTFNKKHNTSLLLGVSNESFTSETNRLYRRFTDPDLGTPISGSNIDLSNTQSTNQGTVEYSLNSFFGRANYSYDDKYYGEVNFRVDASSKFNNSNRTGFFPSISGGYRISQEPFMQNYRSKFGDLKIRGSYGILGNQNVDSYQFETVNRYTANPVYGFNNTGVSGVNTTFGNADLTWERAATFNLGIDATFFKNALTVTLDYFNKHTKDILVPPTVPGTFGASLPLFNAGELQNRGWEVNVNYRINGKNLKHTFGINLADSKNKVLQYQGGSQITSADEMQYLTQVGLPFRSYYGLQQAGYFQTQAEADNSPKPAGLAVGAGDIRFVDQNGDGVIDDLDRKVIGNPFPRYTYGFTYNLQYKQFDLNIFIQGVGKRDQFIRGELVEPFHYNYGQTMYEHQLDYWTPSNTDARYPRLAANGSASNTNNYRRASDFYIFNAAYARLKNVQVGFNLPQSVANKLGMQKLRAYISGQNLLTLSPIKFLDPEVTEFNNSLNNNGSSNSGRVYPTPVYVGIGLDVNF